MDKYYKKPWAKAYCDGSYFPETMAYGAGVYIIKGDEEQAKYSYGMAQEAPGLRQVTGEIKAVSIALDWAIANGETKLEILYDYSGIENIATGAWGAKKKETKEYQKYVQGAMEQIEVIFTKVKGHSGNRYHNYADKLAKNGALNAVKA